MIIIFSLSKTAKNRYTVKPQVVDMRWWIQLARQVYQLLYMKWFKFGIIYNMPKLSKYKVSQNVLFEIYRKSWRIALAVIRRNVLVVVENFDWASFIWIVYKSLETGLFDWLEMSAWHNWRFMRIRLRNWLSSARINPRMRIVIWLADEFRFLPRDLHPPINFFITSTLWCPRTQCAFSTTWTSSAKYWLK